jgi:hypothetical protein
MSSWKLNDPNVSIIAFDREYRFTHHLESRDGELLWRQEGKTCLGKCRLRPFPCLKANWRRLNTTLEATAGKQSVRGLRIAPTQSRCFRPRNGYLRRFTRLADVTTKREKWLAVVSDHSRRHTERNDRRSPQRSDDHEDNDSAFQCPRTRAHSQSIEWDQESSELVRWSLQPRPPRNAVFGWKAELKYLGETVLATWSFVVPDGHRWWSHTSANERQNQGQETFTGFSRNRTTIHQARFDPITANGTTRTLQRGRQS